MPDGSTYARFAFEAAQREQILERVEEALEWVPDGLPSACLLLKVSRPYRDEWEKRWEASSVFNKKALIPILIDFLFANPLASAEVLVLECMNKDGERRLGRIATVKGNG